MRELDLLAQLKSALPHDGARVLRGVGDDAAVIATDGVLVTSVDQTVEGVHADMSFFTHRQFGARAMLAAISDLSAMGIAASEALLAVVLGRETSEEEALDLFRGASEAASKCGVSLVGGDIAIADTLTAAVTVIGHAQSAQSLIPRDGAKPGDLIGVTGSLGASGAGLIELRQSADATGTLASRHLNPVYRGPTGQALAACPVSSMIDISDGLATDAGHIGRASDARLVIDIQQIPIADGVGPIAASAGIWNLMAWTC